MGREQEVAFVYELGVLKPEEPLDLPEGARGIAHIREVPAPSDPAAAAARALAVAAIRRIGASGVFNSGGRRLSRDEMHERG